ncbi:MAG: YlxM family DNA-binding protein [Clostridia bacterium]|nr:YlxM family DNA-binding protein [Clostridia bacterium]
MSKCKVFCLYICKQFRFVNFSLDKAFFLYYNAPCKVSHLYTEGAFIVAKNLDLILLLDFYGDMLTPKQREFVDYYYNDDLSLAEIAQNVGITRQGVRDAIKRAEVQLTEMEDRLGLVSRFQSMQSGLNEIIECADAINKENLNCGLSREINDLTVRIQSIALSLSE